MPEYEGVYQQYCWEFQQSLLNYDNGNWFGRLAAFEFEMALPNGSKLNQVQFQSLLANGLIKITSMVTDLHHVVFEADETEDSCEYKKGLIKSEVELEANFDGLSLNGTYQINHKVKPAFQSKYTVISSPALIVEAKKEDWSTYSLEKAKTGFDQNNLSHVFCNEIDKALIKFAGDHPAKVQDFNGNWFGRLFEFAYEVDLIGNTFKETKDNDSIIQDKFRDGLRNKQILLNNYQTIFNSVVFHPDSKDPNLAKIIAYVIINLKSGKFDMNNTYSVTYDIKLKNWQATKLKAEVI